jgi:Rrf2 family protein
MNGGGEGSPVTLKDISKRHNLSDKYLWQVVTPLKSAGIVSAVPGANGGYQLIRPPRDISLRDLVDAVEGASLGVGGTESAAEFDPDSVSTETEIWQEVAEQFSGILEAITLENLMKRESMRRAVKTADYCI